MLKRFSYSLNNLFISAVLGLMFLGCKPQNLNEEALMSYASDPDNGLLKAKKIKGIDVSVGYRPKALMVIQELGKTYTNEELEEARGKYQDYEYFILDLSLNDQEVLRSGIRPVSGFNDLLSTMAFKMDQFAYLTTSDGDNIPVADFVFPRTFGLSNSTQILIVFNNQQAKGDDWWEFHLKEMGLGIGKQHFRFNRQDLEQIPELIYRPTQNPK